jgi:hypothetical protein
MQIAYRVMVKHIIIHTGVEVEYICTYRVMSGRYIQGYEVVGTPEGYRGRYIEYMGYE